MEELKKKTIEDITVR